MSDLVLPGNCSVAFFFRTNLSFFKYITGRKSPPPPGKSGFPFLSVMFNEWKSGLVVTADFYPSMGFLYTKTKKLVFPVIIFLHPEVISHHILNFLQQHFSQGKISSGFSSQF
jgi:hypothetical protein